LFVVCQGVAIWRGVTGSKNHPDLSKFRQITGDKIAGVTGVFHGISPGGGPSQQTTKGDGLSHSCPVIFWWSEVKRRVLLRLVRVAGVK
jgi:hypothetical protein